MDLKQAKDACLAAIATAKSHVASLVEKVAEGEAKGDVLANEMTDTNSVLRRCVSN